jgi:hypothetical protein
MEIIKNEKRGFSDYKWCKGYFCYSFGPYFNPLHEDFGSL